MPTGYTSIIEDNPETTFADYLWRCARGMGACIDQRDDSTDVPVRMDSTPYDYHKTQLVERSAKLAELQAMPLTEAETRRAAEAAASLAEQAASVSHEAKLVATYKAMLVHVNEWTPPSAEHEGLKTFMRQQIELCLPKPWQRAVPAAVHETAQEWLDRRIARAAKDVDYATTEWREERERTAGRNHWKRQLAASVPQPAPQEAP